MRRIMAEAVRRAYQTGQEDETLEPLVLVNSEGQPLGRIQSDDSVIFYNIRGEREIELTQSLTQKGFSEFPVKPGLNLKFVTMIEYQKSLDVQVAFPPEDYIEDTLSEILSLNKIKQAKITEAEKAVHVGYFLNGKRENPFAGEERVIVPTRKNVALFDEAPEMSIEAVAKAIIEKTVSKDIRFIFANLCNVDVVSHIENEKAVIQAIEAVDRYMGIVVNSATAAGMTVIITADHGSAERWRYKDGAVDTGHTDSPVPFILIDPFDGASLRQGGDLTDIAPTVLDLFGISKPDIMTGCSLINRKQAGKAKDSVRLLLILLDGWGISKEGPENLISQADTPNMDSFLSKFPNTILRASGEAVGLPAGMVGNSEAGHLHIGVGRKIFADRVRIDRAISDGSFFKNKAFCNIMENTNRNLHLMGIVSFFSSHGSIHHLFALMEMARNKGIRKVFIHAMLGRRGELPESGARYIEKIEEKAEALGLGLVASVIGRYWPMDREYNWDRIEKTYRMLLQGKGTPVYSVA